MKLLICLFVLCQVTNPPPASDSGAKPELTEGLLDLLKEPAKTEPDTKMPAPKANAGEDIGPEPIHPLAEVEAGMRIVSMRMRAKRDADRTRQLQRDVVLRLDDLIGQLEKQSSSSSTSAASSSQENSSAAQRSEQRPAANGSGQMPKPNGESRGDSQDKQANSTPSGQANNQPESKGGQPMDGRGGPGASSAGPRNVAVDLNDPQALQRSAWGTLPERVREQMQSRMVERFLPAYRDEIEAYYRR